MQSKTIDSLSIIVGITITLIAIYFLANLGYHLIFYKYTWGLEEKVFGYPKSYSGILIKFVYSILLIISGISFLTKNIRLMKFAKIIICSGILISLAYLIFSLNHYLKYEPIVVIGNTEVEMNLKQKFNIIYKIPIFSFIIFISQISFLILLNIKIKLIKKHISFNERYAKLF